MKKTISAKQKSVGRPPTGVTPMMGFRADPVIRAAIVRWAEKQPDMPSLSEAIRRLVEIGLRRRGKWNRPMKWVETTITENSVHVRLADDADPAKAAHWVDCQMPIAKLVQRSDAPLPNPPGSLPLAAIQAAALRAARASIDEEIARLSSL